MSKVRLLGILVIALVLLNGALLFLIPWKSATGAPPNDPEPPAPRGGPRELIIKKLSLDESQVKSYEALITEHRKAVDANRQAVQATKRTLYTSLQSGQQISGEQRAVLLHKLGDLQEEIEAVHYQHFEAIRALCKGKQIAAFDALSGELASLFGAPPPPPPPPLHAGHPPRR